MVTAVARPDTAGSRQVVGRVVRVARTTPGRLAVTGAVLVVLALLAGLFAFLAVRDRAEAAERVATRSEPLGARTQELYRALAEADAAAAAGLLSGGVEKQGLRDDYIQSLDTAQRTLMAAKTSGTSGRVEQLLSQLSVEIPRYREDVARAKAETRQGHPVGAAYLRAASRQMERVILPAADELHGIAAKKLRDDHDEATSVPWTAMAAGLCALAALVAAQVMLARRTKRVFNPGLVLAALAVATALAWLTTSLGSARDDLARSRDDGWRPADALSAARFSVLQARAAEGQILVQNGSDNNEYENRFNQLFGKLTAAGPDGLVAAASARAAGDATTTGDITKAEYSLTAWRNAHEEVMRLYRATKFSGAVDMVVNDGGASQVAFAGAEQALADAIAKDQADFDKAVGRGRDAMDGLAVGVLVLAVVAAAGIVDGVRRRLGEYR
ncbi:MAG: hypothetical protein HOV68_01115 [Streptomycetaceae bacterium]|nr:hypothetical protein [Streptomycetaceae bacterium]